MYDCCPIFGMCQKFVYVWRDYGLAVLKRVLKSPDLPACVIKWTSLEEMKLSASLMTNNRKWGHLLQGVFGVMDGGRIMCSYYKDEAPQNGYYEGFTQNVEVTNLFVFNFFGELIHAGINYPGAGMTPNSQSTTVCMKS